MDIIQSLPGSPEPKDPFEPHMPGVDVLADMDAFFHDLRGQLSGEGERHVAIVTPGRMTMLFPVPSPNRGSDQAAQEVREMLPAEGPLDIAVISYTRLDALTEDSTKTRCIPFLGYLVAFAYIGHRVIVFEGHPSALEAGVRGCDVLVIDSGMLPFLQEDWSAVVFRNMRSPARVFIHDRESYNLQPVVPSKEPPGWRYSERDGEASYVNCLFTTLAKGPFSSVKLQTDGALPDLSELTQDPRELEWISGLPFRYDQLNAEEVIQLILCLAGWGKLSFFKTEGTFNAVLALGQGQPRPVSFHVKSGKTAGGGKEVTVTKR